jgi:hypothetical protein
MIKLPMIRLHGVGIRTTPTSEVTFVCPRCGVDRAGAIVEQQRWYCVLRVPVVPLATLDPAVECDSCGHLAGLGVLDVLTAEALTNCLATAMRYSAASVVLAGIEDGQDVEPEVLDEVYDAMLAMGYEYDDVVLFGDLAAINDEALRKALRPLVDELTPHGKQGFLHRMTALALADGSLTRREQEALVEIGVGLGMAAPHINGVLATAANHYQAAA